MYGVNEDSVPFTPPAGKPISPSRVLRLAQPDPTLREKIRARLIDDTLDADRRLIGERVAVLFRWLFLVVLAVLNNVTPHTSTEDRVTVDIVLGAWAAMNIAINVLLLRGYKPGKQFSLSTMSLDIFFAAGLVYLSNGFSSPFFLALFLAVITNAVRFGAAASVASAVIIALIYLFVGGSFTPSNFAFDPNPTIGKVFLFVGVALSPRSLPPHPQPHPRPPSHLPPPPCSTCPSPKRRSATRSSSPWPPFPEAPPCRWRTHCASIAAARRRLPTASPGLRTFASSGGALTLPSRVPTVTRRRSLCFSSTSITSKRRTTSSATSTETWSCSSGPGSCGLLHAPRISWLATAGTSSPSWSRTSTVLARSAWLIESSTQCTQRPCRPSPAST